MPFNHTTPAALAGLLRAKLEAPSSVPIQEVVAPILEKPVAVDPVDQPMDQIDKMSPDELINLFLVES